MRSFLILCTIISAAYAASFGYNYQSNGGAAIGGSVGDIPVIADSSNSYSNGGNSYSNGVSPHSNGANSYNNGANSYNNGANSYSKGGKSYSNGANSYSNGANTHSNGANSYNNVGSTYGTSALSLGNSGQFDGSTSQSSQAIVGPSYSAPAVVESSQTAHAAAPAPFEVNKEFYSYSAPEYAFSDIGDSNQVANSLKKSLRVVFIKGPESNGIENAAVQLAKAATEERTAIYVLSKQADVGKLATKLQTLDNSHSHKPEVHFVKYRTQNDAENAQRAIQSQYDGLEGPTITHNGGVADVLDYATVKEQPQQQAAAAQQEGGGGNAESAYLPPSKRV